MTTAWTESRICHACRQTAAVKENRCPGCGVDLSDQPTTVSFSPHRGWLHKLIALLIIAVIVGTLALMLGSSFFAKK